jgi:class 3 adenylate cyclase/pimeloyl-ACP methyl ester carboxylesterase
MIEPRIQYVASADGTQIAHTTFGDGPPLVIPANAWGDIALFTSSRSSVSIFTPLLARDFRLVLYDGRGSGASDRNPADMSLAARLSDLEAVVGVLAIDSFAMFGVVHGTQVAVAYAAKHPERVTHLVLYAPYARGSEYYSATPMMRAIRVLAEMAEDQWDFYTATLANWTARFNDPEGARLTAELYREGMTARDYLALIAACEESDITPFLPEVTAPTLVIRDSSSPFMTPDSARRVAAGIPGAQSITVEGPAAMGVAAAAFLRGEPSPPTPIMGTGTVVTVLFTDIVGHTEMMRRLGDEKGREVLREHEAVTRDVLKAHGGTEVKTMGDGFMASFASVTRAVECAIALQSAIDERNRDAGAHHDAPLRVRCGLNAGEPIEDEGDLFGSSVILASRIAAKAQGGEIFASLAVRELCAGKGFLFADLGDHELRGFEDPVRVFEVKWR